MNFDGRYKKLNDAQRAAVDTIDGPLMVVAGPGTGKTELLSMRTANILRTTDTLPQNILCLTFTESGALAMRERLASIIGADAYKVAIHTFHSFGSEMINQYPEYFYQGATLDPASDLRQYELLASIFSELPHNNPLSGMMNDRYIYQADVRTIISELKRSGLTNDELLAILSDNERTLDAVEASLADVFSIKIAKQTKEALIPIATAVAELSLAPLPAGIASLQDVLALSLSHAYDQATETDSTKPITAWRNQWMEKDARGSFIFKDRKRIAKLRAVAHVYYSYLNELQKDELYDFDDMVLYAVHALETNDELRFNLQEKYLYIMVDEFQDTNLAQARILSSLTNNPANEGAPNIMIVGDDDQAIYSFQGADLSNILQFRQRYESTSIITLTENYRSSKEVLEASRSVIALGQERLEVHYPELSKSLHANIADKSRVELHEFSTTANERAWIAASIKEKIKSGVAPGDISVIARRHHELISLLPYLSREEIEVNYERRENILTIDTIKQLILLVRTVHHLALGQHAEADAILPELFAHPAWHISAENLWRLSITAYDNKSRWLDEMMKQPEFIPLAQWLIDASRRSLIEPLEATLDYLLGVSQDTTDASETTYQSPLYGYFFSKQRRADEPELYLMHLDALRTLRDKLREHTVGRDAKLGDLLEFIDLQDMAGSTLINIHGRSTGVTSSINLMTAHKSKGLEFAHVYIIGAVDSSWGERVRSKARLVSYPANLPLAPVGDTFDERLRLMYVAMTRAKTHLSISYSLMNETGSQSLLASFLTGEQWHPIKHTDAPSIEANEQMSRLAWYVPLSHVTTDLKTLLAPTLERYKLSATHLNAFLDVTRGGPNHFLIQNLLRFPSAMSANAAYGSAVHRTLQHTHARFTADKTYRPIEDIIGEFDKQLEAMHLSAEDFDHFSKRGGDYLQRFFEQMYDSFTTSQRTELNFANQSVQLDEARLTGSLDLVDIDRTAKTIIITDYKTGKPASGWQGKDDREKIKLHKYRQQLMFYTLLVTHSRDYSHLAITDAILQFVEPNSHGDIVALHAQFSNEELQNFACLIQAVWQKIITLELPDTSSYEQNYKGILAFEQDLLT